MKGVYETPHGSYRVFITFMGKRYTITHRDEISADAQRQVWEHYATAANHFAEEMFQMAVNDACFPEVTITSMFEPEPPSRWQRIKQWIKRGK